MAGIDIRAEIDAIEAINAVPEILQVVIRTTGLRFAAVARVTESHWIACAVHDLIDFGLRPGDELVLESTICNEIRQHHQPVIFGHASQHPIFATHHTPLQYGFESYVSIPILRSNGEFYGTLCALDPLPSELNADVIGQTLGLLAQLIASNLDLHDRLQTTDLALQRERETAHLREQFIAVLGHDLRTPLNAVRLAADLLERKPLDESARQLAHLIQSSAARMGGLIEDVLDFARGQLGEGVKLALEPPTSFEPWLRQVVAESQAGKPGEPIEVSIDLPHAVNCDRARIGQLLTNLLANAITHGDPERTIHVDIAVHHASFTLAVRNQGRPIPADDLPLIFQPFTRGQGSQPREGLGLGLYICAHIAKAHQGTLKVASTAQDGTCFTLHFPLALAS